MSSAKQTQRDLLAILDRMSLSIDGTRTDLGSTLTALIESHQALAASVLVMQDRLATLEAVVLSQSKVIETQTELMSIVLKVKQDG